MEDLLPGLLHTLQLLCCEQEHLAIEGDPGCCHCLEGVSRLCDFRQDNRPQILEPSEGCGSKRAIWSRPSHLGRCRGTIRLGPAQQLSCPWVGLEDRRPQCWFGRSKAQNLIGRASPRQIKTTNWFLWSLC